MLSRLKSLLTGSSQSGGAGPADDLSLAAAALLVEAAEMDGQMDVNERRHILGLLRGRFALEAGEAEDLLSEAEERSARTHQLLPFTQVIKARFSHEQRVELMEMLWEVAYADGHLHDYEANLVRRIGGLIYVPDQDSGNARKRAMARLGITDPMG